MLRTSVQETTDEALIGLIADGDKRAMQVLYARHNVRVYRFIVRLTGKHVAGRRPRERGVPGRLAAGGCVRSEVSGLDLAARDRPLQGAVCAAPPTSDEQLDDKIAATIEDTSDNPETIVSIKDRSTHGPEVPDAALPGSP